MLAVHGCIHFNTLRMIPNHGMVSTVATSITLSHCVYFDRFVDCCHIMKTLQTSLPVRNTECNKVCLDDGVSIFTNPGVSKRQTGCTDDLDEAENLYLMLHSVIS